MDHLDKLIVALAALITACAGFYAVMAKRRADAEANACRDANVEVPRLWTAIHELREDVRKHDAIEAVREHDRRVSRPE